MKRKFAKVDANQAEVVKALRAAGCSVQSLAAVGNGTPDLLVSRNGRNVLMEVKDGSRCPSARKLTPQEIEWHAKWKSKVEIVLSIEEALNAINQL